MSKLPTTIEVPVHFGLAGKVMVPEARATVAFEEIARAIAPARPLVIRERGSAGVHFPSLVAKPEAGRGITGVWSEQAAPGIAIG
jgi:hypothetical protein